MIFKISTDKKAHTLLSMCFLGDPPETRTPDPLIKSLEGVKGKP